MPPVVLLLLVELLTFFDGNDVTFSIAAPRSEW